MGYNTYENYKYSGIKWANNIPNHWNINKLKRIFKFEKGKNAQEYTEEYINSIGGSFPVYSGQTKNEGILGYIDSYEYDFDKNVILVTTVGAKAMTTFRIQGKLSLSQNCALIKLKSDEDISDYYFYLCKILFNYERELIPDIMQPSLRIGDLNTYNILQPSKEEQIKIASFLDKKTSEIDKNIAKNKELINLLEEKKTALINQVVTKGLNPNVPMKDSGIEWIGEIPEHWKLSILNRYADVTKLAGFEFTKYIKYIPNGEIIALRALNIKNNKLNLENIVKISKEVSDMLPRSKLYKGDIIFTYVGAKTGAVAIIDEDDIYHLAPNIAKITNSYKNLLNTKFLLYQLSSYHEQEEIWLKISKSGQEAISMEKIRTLSLLIPPIDEQEKIILFLENNINHLDNIINKCQENIALLNEYKTSLIYHVVTGKIDVRDEV